MTAPIPKLQTLQVLRGFAALLIVVYHIVKDIEGLYGLPQNDFWNVNPLFYGIDLFFVLSGFVMVYTAYGQTGLYSAKNFMLRRLVRIAPLYWFYSFLLLVIFLVLPSVLNQIQFSLDEFVKSLFFIPYYDYNDTPYPFLKLGWTLNYEIYFYTVFAVFLLLPPKFMMPALTVFFLVTVFLKELILPEGLIRNFYGRDIILNFLAGTWIGFLFIKGVRLPKNFIYLGLAILIVSLAWLLNSDFVLDVTGYRFPKIFFASLTVALLVLPKASEFIQFPKNIVFIGDSSYSLYLIHSFIIGTIIYAMGVLEWQEILSPWLILMICVIASVIGGGISYLLIEKPLLSWAKQLLLPREEINRPKNKN